MDMSKHNHPICCDCIHRCTNICNECCYYKKNAKYIYDYTTINKMQNRASVSIGNQIFWSNTVTIKKLEKFRYTSYY